VSEDRGALRLEITGLERRINHLQQENKNTNIAKWLIFIWLAVISVFTTATRAQCTDLDFNNDGVYPSDADTTDFSNVLAGADCPTCDTIDFNGDGVFPDDRDFTDWLAVLAGGPCSNGGFTPVVCAGCPVLTVDAANPSRASISAVLSSLPRITTPDGVSGTPAIINVPFGTWDMAVNWPGMDGLAYGGLPNRPLIIRGLPGPNGERPTLRIPNGLGAGVRIVGGLRYIEIRGLRLVGENHGAIVAIQGDAKNILIEDCELVGGAIGVSIQGMDKRTGPIRIRRNIIRDQRHPVSHSQGIFASADTMTLIDSNVFYNNGSRNQFCHGMYLVHTAGATRIVVNNWVGLPGSAAIQARGGDFTIQSNVCWNFNTGIGTGHPMAYNATDEAKTVWTSATVSNNLLADAREGEPAQWGFSYMLGKPTAITGNIVRGVARPWMSSTDQGLRVPVGEVTRENNDVKTTSSGIDWQPIIATLLSRKSGEWGERFETGGVIDRSKP
jgi:hypothetical protein